MSACVHCHGRKGKRSCPALNGTICSACCGEYRLVEIQCPSDCRYLNAHETYQRRRTLDHVPPIWVRRVMAYERKGPADQLVVHELQRAMCRYDAEQRRLDLPTLQEGLGFARRRMSLIETPEPLVPPFGEHLVRVLDELIKRQAPVDREGVRQVLDETSRHLEAEVPADQFENYLKFLRALYADSSRPTAARSGDSPLIVPG